jgi:hypothetical protein
MSGSNSFVFAYPIFFAFVYGVAIVQWTCVGRFMLGAILPHNSPNYIWRWFRLLTDWVMYAMRFVTPLYVRPVWVPLIAFFWLGLLRLVGSMVLFKMGLAPMLSGTGAEGG